GEKAFRIGLVNDCVAYDNIDETIDKLIAVIKTSGPEAVAVAKQLCSSVPKMSPEEYKPFTAEMIAKLRVSDEGQEGMNSFLEKRKPKWSK
ncbi:MAG: enoyl-CoA hydratase/isomerase family protein, partial [candidate division Zixibacteria bacterium]|nr:enoyl-CoA hydratase/isomerase family protein [candidate division Zixibacteria bacterium]